VNDLPQNSSPVDPQAADTDATPMRSPIRPKAPDMPEAPKVVPSAPTPEPPPQAEDPQTALEQLRHKMEVVASEFSQGKINRAQFNAIYGRYSEQRTIIERLIERNPENPAWKQAAAPGHTRFLRDHFEARLQYYLVYQHTTPTPLMMGGKQQPNMDQVSQVLNSLWGMKNRPKIGLARKDMGSGQWLVLALGEYAVTLTLFLLEPSATQANLVRDLHADFERANRRALERGTRSLDRFVFPQRALTEKQF
jgi:hypothetical protein